MTNFPNNQELGFVLHHYRKGMFNPDEAMKKVKIPARRKPMYRWVAAAASLLCLVAFATVLTWQAVKTDTPAKTDAPVASDRQEVVTQPTATFHFDDTPLPEVLGQLSSYYGVQLQADSTDKHLTADFTADSLDTIIDMIEQVLDVEIIRIDP